MTKIYSSAPCRIGLFGGGTDLTIFYESFGGICINMAINIRQVVIIGGEEKLLPSDNPEFLKAFTKEKVEHIFDGELESGLGSSAALAVALTSAHPYYNKRWKDMHYWIANNAWEVEVNKLKLYGGEQDQYSSSYGGLNTFTFRRDGIIERKDWNKETGDWLISHILLFYTGIKRKNPKIQEELKELSDKKLKALQAIKRIAELANDALAEKDFDKLSVLMEESWINKKRSNPYLLTPEIKRIFDMGLKNGAKSGKLCGSGGGGYMMFFVKPEDKENLIQNMEKIEGVKNVPFEIDYKGVETYDIK
jgi:D-glycero-alpha-D-manno-heptose-7-phosphate kinase